MHSLLLLITQELANIRQQLGPESELLLQGVSYKLEYRIWIVVIFDNWAQQKGVQRHRNPKTSSVETLFLIRVSQQSFWGKKSPVVTTVPIQDKRHPVF